MINHKQISEEQAMSAAEHGEFAMDIITSTQRVIVIMTQDWCPQWTALKSWVYEIQTDENIDVYELEYNKLNSFNDFMNFKENQWGNYNIPYLRFYNNGKLISETNYISKDEFMNIIMTK